MGLPRTYARLLACRRLIVVLALSLAGVTGHPQQATAIEFKAPLPDPPVLSQAKRLLDKGEAESAATVLRRFLATSPRPEHLDDTYLLLGAALYGMREYPEAIKYLNQLQTEFPASDVGERGKILLARTHAAMGNIDLALPLLTQLRTSTAADDTKHEALRLTAEFLVQKKEYVRAIEALLQESAAGTEEHLAETRTQIREFINEKLDKKALTRLHDLYPKSFPGDLAAIRLIDLYTSRGEDHLAERQIQQFLAQFPEHPYIPKATETLALLKTRLKANQFFIATVLPLSGRLAPFANEVLEGIQLAVERAREQPGMPPVGLIVKDNESDKPSFLEDHATLLNEDRPLAVIGPMLSKNLPVMAEMAEHAKVPLITPAATFPNVRRLGSFVFSTTLTYALQAKRIAGYATGEQGYRRFCILYPDTTYGREQARLFAQEVRQHEGEIIAMESFKEGDSDFSSQIKNSKPTTSRNTASRCRTIPRDRRESLSAKPISGYSTHRDSTRSSSLAAPMKSACWQRNSPFTTSRSRSWEPTDGTRRTSCARPIAPRMGLFLWMRSSWRAPIPPFRILSSASRGVFKALPPCSPCRATMPPGWCWKRSAGEPHRETPFVSS